MFPLYHGTFSLIKHSSSCAGLKKPFWNQNKKHPDTVGSLTPILSWCSVNKANPEVRLTEQMQPLLRLCVSQPRTNLHCTTSRWECVELTFSYISFLRHKIHRLAVALQWVLLPMYSLNLSFVTALAFPTEIHVISILFLIPPAEGRVIAYIQHQSTLQYSKKPEERSHQRLCTVSVLQERTKGQCRCLVICSLILLSVCQQWHYTD